MRGQLTKVIEESHPLNHLLHFQLTWKSPWCLPLRQWSWQKTDRQGWPLRTTPTPPNLNSLLVLHDNLFHGLSSEDPYAHLATYIEICNMVKIEGVPKDTIQGGNFSHNQGQGWRSHLGNQFNKDQGGPSNRPPNQGPNLCERTTKLEDKLT